MMTVPKQKRFDVFLDLDGVFADFDGKIRDLTGLWPHELPKKELWKTVYKKPDFFASLDMLKGADTLWAYFKQYDPIFLTGAPQGKEMQAQKIQWVKEKFGPEWVTIVLPKREKQLHSGPNKILIDDNVDNVDQWNSKGGYGIIYRGDPHDTIKKVEHLKSLIL